MLFNVYFAIYELYIYYDMINYPLAEIGNKYYDYYVVRYGYFLKSVRYEEYDVNLMIRRLVKSGARLIGSVLITITFSPTIKNSL